MNAIKFQGRTSCCPRGVMLFVDGELDPSKTVDLEEHLKACEACRSQVELIRSMRASLRRSCSRRVPDSFESRLRVSLGVDANQAAEARSPAGSPAWGSEIGSTQLGARSRVAKGRTVWAVGLVAVAACFILVIVFEWERNRATKTAVASAPANSNDELPFDSLLDELVALHANPLPPEEKNPEELTRFEPYVGVPVKRSAMSLLGAPGLSAASSARPSFDGARIHPIDARRAAAVNPQGVAALQYKYNGHRVTVYVFSSRAIPVNRTRLQSRMVREKPLYVGHMRGYSVVAREHAGIGYALTSDLDEDKSAQMVASF